MHRTMISLEHLLIDTSPAYYILYSILIITRLLIPRKKPHGLVRNYMYAILEIMTLSYARGQPR